jgi:hypothetical protein
MADYVFEYKSKLVKTETPAEFIDLLNSRFSRTILKDNGENHSEAVAVFEARRTEIEGYIIDHFAQEGQEVLHQGLLKEWLDTVGSGLNCLHLAVMDYTDEKFEIIKAENKELKQRIADLYNKYTGLKCCVKICC